MASYNFKYVFFRNQHEDYVVMELEIYSEVPDKQAVLWNLKQAIRRWLGQTDEGKEAWGHSGTNFNIGDFDRYVTEPGLKPFLLDVQITGVCCTTILMFDTYEIYDSVLKPLKNGRQQ